MSTRELLNMQPQENAEGSLSSTASMKTSDAPQDKDSRSPFTLAVRVGPCMLSVDVSSASPCRVLSLVAMVLLVFPFLVWIACKIHELWYMLFVSLLAVGRSVVESHPESHTLPIIFDNDGNYDDILALIFLAKHPLFDVKAITLEATGFATPHGGPTNINAIAKLVGLKDVPIAYGEPVSLSPVTAMPLQWRMELDIFIESLYNFPDPIRPDSTLLQPQHTGISIFSAPDLILKTLRESTEPMYILCTGPLTNLAVAFAKEPSIVTKIAGAFMMGSAYDASNNVYDWQMHWNGVFGSCTEAANQDFTTGSMPLSGVVPPQDPKTGNSAVRYGCRGVNMTEHGRSEWNVFLDALAWYRTTHFLGNSGVPLTILTSNASINMPVVLEDVRARSRQLDDKSLALFMEMLVESFLTAGEARWWDAQLAVTMAQELMGNFKGACQTWLRDRRTVTSLVWRSSPDPVEGNPYGSTIDDLDKFSKEPPSDYCTYGVPEEMHDYYWPVLNGRHSLSRSQETSV